MDRYVIFIKKKVEDIDIGKPLWRGLSKAFIDNLETILFQYNCIFLFFICYPSLLERINKD